MLRIENCSIRYHTGHCAVDHVSLELGKGEIISIVGESGSGKTTLIRSVAGLLPAGAKITEGSIWFQGQDLAVATEDELQAVRGNQIAMVFQNPGEALDPIRRIDSQYRESIRAHNRRMTKENCRQMARRMLRAVHLTDVDRVLRSYPVELSGGMKQRVSIAMAMTARPLLLLADEPTSALDVTIQAQVVRELKELREKYGTSMILVTHNMGVASYLSDKIGVMHEGKMIEFGSRNQVIFHPQETYTRKLLETVPRLGGKRYAR